MESKKFQEELVKLSEADNYIEAVEEWEPVLDKTAYLCDKNNVVHCLCGQRLTYLYNVKNVKNNIEITVGCDCIEKFMPGIFTDEKWMSCKKMIEQVAKDKALLAYNTGSITLFECAFYHIHKKEMNKLTLNTRYINKMNEIVEKIKNTSFASIDLRRTKELYAEVNSKMNELKEKEEVRNQCVSILKDYHSIKAYIRKRINLWEAAFYELHYKNYHYYGNLSEKQTNIFRKIQQKIYLCYDKTHIKPKDINKELLDELSSYKEKIDDEIYKQKNWWYLKNEEKEAEEYEKNMNSVTLHNEDTMKNEESVEIITKNDEFEYDVSEEAEEKTNKLW